MQNETLGGTKVDWHDWGSKFYNPELGEWHSFDPQAGKMTGIAAYAFCNRNPDSYVDTNGEFAWEALGDSSIIKELNRVSFRSMN